MSDLNLTSTIAADAVNSFQLTIDLLAAQNHKDNFCGYANEFSGKAVDTDGEKSSISAYDNAINAFSSFANEGNNLNDAITSDATNIETCALYLCDADTQLAGETNG